MKLCSRKRIFISVLAILAAVEITLRLAFGLGSPVLVQADRLTGYRFQPNQRLVRFGQRIEYNQFSQRSEPITVEKPQGVWRILMLGDSVLNGGTPTDQSQTISELLREQLSTPRRPVQVLNASAGSWGIGNQLGYLRAFGMFHSDAVILQIGSSDLVQPTSTSAVVGRHPAYPTHRPLLAVQEAITRYLWPRLLVAFGFTPPSLDLLTPTTAQPDQQFQQNLRSLVAIVALVRAQNTAVWVLFTPNLNDLVPTPTQPAHKGEFLQALTSLRVPVLDTHAAWSALPTATVTPYFRDSIHLNAAGNQAVANLLRQKLCAEPLRSAC